MLPAKLPQELMPTKGRAGSFGTTPPPTAPGMYSYAFNRHIVKALFSKGNDFRALLIMYEKPFQHNMGNFFSINGLNHLVFGHIEDYT